MVRREIIQLQGTALEPIGDITYTVRTTVSKICLGIDDMQLLGNKALVIRAEIYPEKLLNLYSALDSIDVSLYKQSLPNIEMLKKEIEYPLSLQITSFSDDTDRKINIPNVPG